MTVTCVSLELLLQYWPRPWIGMGHFVQSGAVSSKECVRKEFCRLEYVLWLTASTSPVHALLHRSKQWNISRRQVAADKGLLNTVTSHGSSCCGKVWIPSLVGDPRKRTVMDTLWRGDAVSRSAKWSAAKEHSCFRVTRQLRRRDNEVPLLVKDVAGKWFAGCTALLYSTCLG